MNQIVPPNYIATLNTRLHYAAVWREEKRLILLLLCSVDLPVVGAEVAWKKSFAVIGKKAKAHMHVHVYSLHVAVTQFSITSVRKVHLNIAQMRHILSHSRLQRENQLQFGDWIVKVSFNMGG